jgi:hypothetical protein
MLKRRLRNLQREVRVTNFERAQSAVVLFDTQDNSSFPVIKDFMKFLQSKDIQCKVVGYVPQKEVPQELLFLKGYEFVTRKDLNWYRKPGGAVAEAFYGEAADLLLDFSLGTPLELQYLVRLSPARFKIGCFTEEENDYDLMINLSSPCDVAYLAEQFKHYIPMLNPVSES